MSKFLLIILMFTCTDTFAAINKWVDVLPQTAMAILLHLAALP
jgi:hypothetical protein